MTAQALAELARRWIALWNAPADRAAFDDLHDEAFEDRASAGRPPNRDGFFASIVEMLGAFPDLAARVEDLVVDAATGKVAVRWRAEGTNRTRYLGVGPTHRRTVITGIEIIELAHRDGRDRIVRRWGEWDIGDHTGWLDRYLARIGLDGAPAPRADALERLHRAHLEQVPFENLSIHAGEPIQLDVGWLADKIVGRRRGGFCYELNGLFAELLGALGFTVERLAARVFGDGGRLGIPFDHMCLRVDGAWLADVGFGDCFVRPLRLDDRAEQHDGRRGFRIVDDGADACILEDAGRPAYRFERRAYDLADFAPGCAFHQSPASHFRKGRLISRLLPDGRITLRDDRLITTDACGGKTETPVTDAAAWRQIAVERFGLTNADD